MIDRDLRTYRHTTCDGLIEITADGRSVDPDEVRRLCAFTDAEYLAFLQGLPARRCECLDLREAWEEEIRAAEELGAREREAARKVGG